MDYQTLHKYLAHPLCNVILHVRKNTWNFLDIIFPKKDPICPGCAYGKMPNHTFSLNLVHAKKAFELIYLDLKSFLTDSYQKYKYLIIFISQRRVPLRLDNIYGERRHPVQQYKNVEKFSCWKETVNGQPLVPVISESSSLEPLDEVPDIAKLCQEGGVNLEHYLLAKAIRSNENLIKPPHKWSYPISPNCHWMSTDNGNMHAVRS